MPSNCYSNIVELSSYQCEKSADRACADGQVASSQEGLCQAQIEGLVREQCSRALSSCAPLCVSTSFEMLGADFTDLLNLRKRLLVVFKVPLPVDAFQLSSNIKALSRHVCLQLEYRSTVSASQAAASGAYSVPATSAIVAPALSLDSAKVVALKR